MKLYRIDWDIIGESEQSVDWAATKDEAIRKARQVGGDWSVVYVPIDKRGLLDFLKRNIWR